MKKATFAFVILACACLIPFLSAQDVDVTGDWELTMQTQRGEFTSEITFVQEGEKLTVTMEGMRGGGEVTGEGTIKGNAIEWTVTRETPRGKFTMTYSGTVSGSSMSGEVQMRNNTVEWTATKKQD